MYLKIADDYVSAAGPREIQAGTGWGQLTVVPQKNDYAAWLTDFMGSRHADAAKRIFVCRSLTLDLHPVLPCAAGLIFKEGSPLHHLGNVLRARGIPALIDRALWSRATDVAKRQLLPIEAELYCGTRKDYSAQTRRIYAESLRRYCEKLATNPTRLPVYDCREKPSRRRRCRSTWHYGLKALAVNALACEGLAVPETLLLAHFDAVQCDAVMTGPVAAVEKRFPTFGHDRGCQLMVRASFYFSRKSPAVKPATARSCAVRSPAELAEALRRLSMLICDMAPRPPLTVLIQERIPTAVLGVLFTRLPWDFHARHMACDLELRQTRTAPKLLQLTLPAGEEGGGLRLKPRIARCLTGQLPQQLTPSLNRGVFIPAFASFVDKCLDLQNGHFVPLDIEFAVTPDLRFCFTQFRHIFSLS